MSRFRPTAVGDHVFLSDRFKHLIWEFMVLKYSTAQTIIYIYRDGKVYCKPWEIYGNMEEASSLTSWKKWSICLEIAMICP